MSLISILLPDLRGGGVERIRLVLAHEFARNGYEVEFVLLQAKGELLDEANSSFSVVDLNVHRIRFVPLKLTEYLNFRKPSVLLVAMWPLTSISAISVFLSRAQVRLIISEHCDLTSQYLNNGFIHKIFRRLSMSISYRLAHSVVCVSKGILLGIAKDSLMRASSLELIYNPLTPRNPPSSISLQVAEKSWKGPAGSRVLTVGSLKKQKNHVLLLRAFSQLKNINASLLILGDGPERTHLELIAHELGVSDKVEFAGFKKDPSAYFCTADVFVLSSDYEGFGNVILEALGFGLPVVSTDCPHGPAEILAQGKYGKLVPTNDVDLLMSAIESSLKSDRNVASLIDRAADFNPETAARRYLNLMLL